MHSSPVLSTDAIWEEINAGKRLLIIAGPCAIESEELCLGVAAKMATLSQQLNFTYIFKASYDKANRSSSSSFRGPGLESGLKILKRVREEFQVPVLTDIHTEEEATKVAEIVDVLQIPAFLCRQTNLIETAAKTGKIVNIKKGQFLSPWEMKNVADKARKAGSGKLILTERGTTFGYNNLVADMRSIPIMRGLGFPVVFDATHAVQLPGGGGDKSSGQREFAPVLARSAVAAGASGVFIETHPKPEEALSDGPNMIPLAEMQKVVEPLISIYNLLNA